MEEEIELLEDKILHLEKDNRNLKEHIDKLSYQLQKYKSYTQDDYVRTPQSAYNYYKPNNVSRGVGPVVSNNSQPPNDIGRGIVQTQYGNYQQPAVLTTELQTGHVTGTINTNLTTHGETLTRAIATAEGLTWNNNPWGDEPEGV